MSYFLDNTDTNHRALASHKLFRPGMLVMIALAWVMADLMARFVGHVDASWLSGLDAFAALVLFIGVTVMAIQARVAKIEQQSEHVRKDIGHRQFYVVDGGTGLPQESTQLTAEQKAALLSCIDGGSFSPKERG
jgi:hypothetical protein